MSSQCIQVWVKVEYGSGGSATSISIQPGDVIDDVIDRALAKYKVDIPPQYASVRYDGEEVQCDFEAGSYETTYEKPLIIVIDEEATTHLKRSRQGSVDSPEGTAFMKALLSTPTMGGGGDIMRFSVPPPWAYTPYKSLYIRKAYTDLHDIIWSSNGNVVVVGSPGTGKSFFAVYELYLALKEGRTVAFQSVPARRTFLFRPGAAVEELPYPTPPSVSKTGQTLLLYDAGTRSGHQYSNTCDKIVIFSSPYESSYRELQKAGALTVCMPTWSWEEMEYCARSLEEYSSLDITLVRERFGMYGGIARFVLEVDEEVAQENFAELKCALLKCDMGMLQDVVSAKGRDELSHIVFHRTLAKNYDGSPEYHGYTCEFASKYVEKEAYKAMQQGSNSHLIMEFLRSSRDRPILAAVRVSLFESKARDLLMKGGTFKIRKLPGEVEEVHIEEVLDDLTADQGKYFLPKGRNYVALDAIAPPNAAYQMTVSTEHDIQVSGLEKVVKFCNPKTPFRLYFVIPDDIFEVFEKQKYVTQNGETAERIPKSVQAVQQYALCIPLGQ